MTNKEFRNRKKTRVVKKVRYGFSFDIIVHNDDAVERENEVGMTKRKTNSQANRPAVLFLSLARTHTHAH